MISNFCINRPVATTLLAIGLVLAGLAGFRLLPVAALAQRHSLPEEIVGGLIVVVTTGIQRRSPQARALVTGCGALGLSRLRGAVGQQIPDIVIRLSR